MARHNINSYNAKIDRTKTVLRLGRNGILYEYLLPLYGNPFEYYNDAIDVKSHNKKTGRYQPIGDKSYFNFYQLKQINKNQKTKDLYALEKQIESIIVEVFGNE